MKMWFVFLFRSLFVFIRFCFFRLKKKKIKKNWPYGTIWLIKNIKTIKNNIKNYKQIFKNGCGSILDIIFDFFS